MQHYARDMPTSGSVRLSPKSSASPSPLRRDEFSLQMLPNPPYFDTLILRMRIVVKISSIIVKTFSSYSRSAF